MGKGYLFEFAASRDMSIAIKAGATRFGLSHSPVYWSTYPGGYCLAVGVSLRSGDKRRREVTVWYNYAGCDSLSLSRWMLFNVLVDFIVSYYVLLLVGWSLVTIPACLIQTVLSTRLGLAARLPRTRRANQPWYHGWKTCCMVLSS